jgi:16S rRNA (cytosine1402-N4)-methyltransferase
MAFDQHTPVLCHEAIEGLNIKSDSICVDMTLGRAGDSSKMLQRCPQGFLYAIDKDEEALSYSQKALTEIGSNFLLFHGPFSTMCDLLEAKGIKEADAILFDIGVSSPQFDNPERGFSYKLEGPLDMRMDQESQLTAYQVVNTYPEGKLRQIITEYGEDPSASQIAHAIVLAREEKPIRTTTELAEIIKDCLPSFILNKKGHPAKQTFQAIRYEVNSEPRELEIGLVKALSFLSVGGRLAVITFNSLEDRIAKDLFKEKTSYPSENRHLPPVTGLAPLSYRLITRKPIAPSEAEIEINPRAKSAKLRIIERTLKL